MERILQFPVLLSGVVLCLISSAPTTHSGDWPCYMGPNRDGISTETNFARIWPESGPPSLWKREVTPSFGAPSVRDNRVYYLDRNNDNCRDMLVCVELQTGKHLWTHEYYAYGYAEFGGRGQPAIDIENAYSLGPFGDLHCVDRLTGRPKWST